MKAITCPNCGKRMVFYHVEQTFIHLWYTMRCEPCGVRGPIASGRTHVGVKRKAARLTREWIARMEEKTCEWAEKCPVKNRRVVINKDSYMSKIIDDFTNAKAPEFLPRSRKQGSKVTPC